MYLRGQFLPVLLIILLFTRAGIAQPIFPAADFFNLPKDRPTEWPEHVTLHHLELTEAQFLQAAEGSWSMSYSCGGRPTTINERARLGEDREIHWLGAEYYQFSENGFRHWVMADEGGGAVNQKIEVQVKFKLTRDGSRMRLEETSSNLNPDTLMIFGSRRLDEYVDAVRIEETGEVVLRMTHAMGRFSYICGHDDLNKIFTRSSK